MKEKVPKTTQWPDVCVSLLLPISQASQTVGDARLRHVTKEGGLVVNWGETDQSSSLGLFFFALGLVPMSAYR
jgi:hypothetical protein